MRQKLHAEKEKREKLQIMQMEFVELILIFHAFNSFIAYCERSTLVIQTQKGN